jgi:anti-sigma-K factor RskA
VNVPTEDPTSDGSIHALSGAYAVDAVDDLERARFEAHLTECADCRAEVLSLQEAAARLTEISPIAPPPAMRDRVLADIRRVRPLPPPESTAPTSPPTAVRPKPRRGRRLLAAAAAVLAIVGTGTVVSHPWNRGATHSPVDVAGRVLHANDARRVSTTLPGGATATVVQSAALGRAVILTRNLAPAPGGKVYELWLQVPSGRMHPAGLINGAGHQTVVLRGDAAKAKAAGITLEPDGGSAQPTSPPIALFPFPKAST